MPRNKTIKTEYAEIEWNGKTVRIQKDRQGCYPRPVSGLYGGKLWWPAGDKVPLGFIQPGGFNQASLETDGKWKVFQFVSVRTVKLEGAERVVPHAVFRGVSGVNKGKAQQPERHPAWTAFRKATGFKSRHSVRLGSVKRDIRGFGNFPKYKPPSDDKGGDQYNEEDDQSSQAGLQSLNDGWEEWPHWGPRKDWFADQFEELGWDRDAIERIVGSLNIEQLQECLEDTGEDRDMEDELWALEYAEMVDSYKDSNTRRIFAEQDAMFANGGPNF